MCLQLLIDLNHLRIGEFDPGDVHGDDPGCKHAILRSQARVDGAVDLGAIPHAAGAQAAQVAIMELQAVDIDVQVFPEIMIMDLKGRLRLAEQILVEGDIDLLGNLSQTGVKERAGGYDEGKHCQANNDEKLEVFSSFQY